MIELADVRPKGYFLDDEEDAEGVCCVGAPIVIDGEVCAGAISVTGLKVDVPAWRLHQHRRERARPRRAGLAAARLAAGGAGVRRALVVEAPGRLALLERDSLEPGPGEVVISPGLLRSLRHRHRAARTASSIRPSCAIRSRSGTSGRASSRRSARTSRASRPGDRVVAECIIPCGALRRAAAPARRTSATTYAELGFTHEGGASDQVVVPARLVHVLAPDVSLLDAALVEPTSVVMRGLEKADARARASACS